MWEKLRLSDLIIGKRLGQGMFGEVYESKVKGHDGKYAVKILDKSKYKRNQKGYKYLENEIKILQDASHENIVKLYSSDIETPKSKYLVTELCNGGDLDSCLNYYKERKGRPFTEKEVQYIMRQIVSTFKYLHVEKKIIHRDLKLENILLHYDNENDRKEKNILKAKVKIIDFGFARYIDGNIVQSILGSPLYMDPRILFKLNKLELNEEQEFQYNEKADIYSLGVICYTLLTGNQLFEVSEMYELVEEIQKGEFKISVNLSKETISFLNYMLRFDPKKRLDIKKLSEHNFITKNAKDFTSIDREKVGDNLKGSLLIFNMKESIMPYLNKDVFDEKDKIKQIYIDRLNKINIATCGGMRGPKINTGTNKSTNKKEPKIDKDIEKLIWDSIDMINKDEICFEPRMTPFIPGIDQNLLEINE